MLAQSIQVFSNPAAYALCPGDQSITSNTLSTDAFLVQDVPGLNIRFDLFLRWFNPVGGGGLQFSLTVTNSTLFFFSDSRGKEYASGDIIQYSGVGNRLATFTGMISTFGGTLTLSRGLVSLVSTPTILKRNSMFIFTR